MTYVPIFLLQPETSTKVPSKLVVKCSYIRLFTLLEILTDIIAISQSTRDIILRSIVKVL